MKYGSVPFKPGHRRGAFPYIASFAFVVFFSRLAEMFPFFAAIHVNLISFILLFAGFVLKWANNRREIAVNRDKFLVVGLLLIGILGIPFSVWPTGALETCKSVLFINVIIYISCSLAANSLKSIRLFLFSFLFSCLVLVTVLHIHPLIEPVSGRASVTSTYDPNDLALIFAVSFPLFCAFFMTSRWKGRLFSFICILLIISGLLKTGSRGGLLALGVALTMLFFSSDRIKIKLYYKLFIVLAFLAFLASPKADTVKRRWESILKGQDYNLVTDQEGGGGRLAIWQEGIGLFVHHPLLGVGAGLSSTAMGDAYGHASWKTMHNSYLQIAVELGIGGLIIFCIILLRIWQYTTWSMTVLTRRHSNLAVWAGMIRIALVAFFVAGFFLSQAYSLTVIFFLAISSRIYRYAIESVRSN